jgi:hypothetical protein
MAFTMNTLIAPTQTLDDALNRALVSADISKGFEQYFELFDRYYADDVEVWNESEEEPVAGKEAVYQLLSDLLVPLHVMAEVGGLSVLLRYLPICSEIEDEHRADWTLELVGVRGKKMVVTWSSVRRWNGLQIAYERHSEHRRRGELLTGDDLHAGGHLHTIREDDAPSRHFN